MKKATVRDLRYNFREIEAQLNRGEEIELYKRSKMIGRLLPLQPQNDAYPDFAALRKKIFGSRKTPTTGTDLVSGARGES